MLTSEARLGNGGYDTPVTSSAPWSGVALTRVDATGSRGLLDTYVHYGLRDALLCPGQRCEPPPWVQPTVAFDDDGDGFGVLKPGRYGIALLGPAGTPVTAKIRFHGKGRPAAVRTSRKAAAYTATVFDPTVAAPGHTLASRGFARFAPKGDGVVVDGLAVAFVLDAPAAVHNAVCATTDGERTFDTTSGGVTPCADGSGLDILIGPNVSPVLVDVGDRSIGIDSITGAGRGNFDTGLGYEAGVAGAGGRIAAVHFAVAF